LEYLHAALVLHETGKEISEKSIGAIIKAAGGKPDESKIKALVATLTSIDIDEAIKGASLMATAVPGSSSSTHSPEDSSKGTEKEESEKEDEDEGDDLGLSSLFG
jgi:large subunit ribosomal protein L12